MFDIDFFKRINDHYGHLAGDYVLRELAETVQNRIRRDEVFARYGGEEFVIVLPETTMEGATSLAETLREKVATHSFVFQGESIPVTISIGCALVQPNDAATELIQRADEKLYEAKRSGRNRVRVTERKIVDSIARADAALLGSGAEPPLATRPPGPARALLEVTLSSSAPMGPTSRRRQTSAAPLPSCTSARSARRSSTPTAIATSTLPPGSAP
jgi:diguanylate cyclase (GGDEF)-like protein